MKKPTNLLQGGRVRIMGAVLLCVAGLLVFQGQDTWVPDDDNPYIDQPTREAQRHFRPPTTQQPFVITDALGYDNFDIGVNFAEQHLSGNPNNQLQMFFGVNGSPVNQWYTNDGHAWTTSSISLPSGTCCDPWTAYDRANRLFYSVLANGNWVAMSTNNGQTFGPFVQAGVLSGSNDRNTLAADQTTGPYSNYLYGAHWGGSNQFAFYRSTNNGTSWTTTLTGANTTPGNMIAVGPNGATDGGRVVVVSITGGNPVPSTFNFYLSTNGGASFTLVGPSAISPGYVGTLNSANRLVINNARTRPYPMIAFDQSNGPYRGRLYCVYASNVPAGNGNKPDIKCQYSTDGGATWSSEVIVNDNANPSQSDQWFPAIWCDKTDGRLYVKWYDTRNGPTTYQTDVYASYSTNGGASFVTNQRLTGVSWTYPCPSCSPNTNCYRGDYDAIWGERFSAFAIWYDGRNCSYQNMGAYFPDFAMRLNPGVMTLNGINDSGFAYVSIPSVKLYTNTARFTATVTPTPGAGTITVSFLNRLNGTPKDTITTYPDSLRVRIRTQGGVPNQTYTVTVTGMGRIGGADGPPIHKRTIMLTVFTGIEPVSSQLPDKFYLYQNYPNPFNPRTNIRFDIPKAGQVKLSIYDITGKVVATVADQYYNAGKYSMDFDASGLSSGIYFYKLEAGENTAMRKMILVK